MAYAFFYWPNIQGRGEFVRLALEATRTPYRDVCREDGIAAMQRVIDEADHPPFACPFLQDGSVLVAQTAAILQHIGPRIGLAPKGTAPWLHQVQLTIADLVDEIHDTHHPLGAALFFEDQRPEARRRAGGFLAERLPRFLDWLAAVQARNPAGPAHLVGAATTYADLSLFQVVEGLRYAFPRFMAGFEAGWPGLAALHDAVGRLPALQAYLRSDRRVPFSEHGVFRHYPELDRPGG